MTGTLEQLTATAKFLGRTISRWLNHDKDPRTVGFILIVIDTETGLHSLASNLNAENALELLEVEMNCIRGDLLGVAPGDTVGHA